MTRLEEQPTPGLSGVVFSNVRRLRQSAFVKNVSIVMSGTAAAQLITFALTPLISRLFTPEDFGVFGSYQSVLGVLAAGVTLQYSQAVMLPKEKEDAISLFYVSCLSVLLVSFLCLLACLIFPAKAMSLLNTPNAWVPVLLAVSVLVNGLNQSIQAWCVRRKEFTRTSASQVIRSLSASGVWTAGGFAHGGSFALILGTVLGDLAANANLVRCTLRDIRETLPGMTWKRIRSLSHEYRDFPLYSATQSLMNALSQGLPVLLLGHYYGIAIAGGYAFGIRLLQTPMNLVLTALRQVLFQKASETHNNGQSIFPLFARATGGLAAIAVLPSVVMFLWAPGIFALVFGHAWHDAGEYARWLVLWLSVLFCNVPASLCARIMRQQRNMFLFECAILSSRLSILVVGGLYCSVLQTIILFSFAGVVLNAAFILWIAVLLAARRGQPCA